MKTIKDTLYWLVWLAEMPLIMTILAIMYIADVVIANLPPCSERQGGIKDLTQPFRDLKEGFKEIGS